MRIRPSQDGTGRFLTLFQFVTTTFPFMWGWRLQKYS